MAKGERKGVKANGSKIKELRRRRGLSQKALGREANVTERTLQRAEKGEIVMPEMLTAIATGLKTDVEELLAVGVSRSETTLPDDPHNLLVRLIRTKSANELANRIMWGEKPRISWDVDPDAPTAEKIATVIELIEGLALLRSVRSTADHMRDLGRLNSLLADLDKNGIGVFMGSYQEFTVKKEEEYPKKAILRSSFDKLIRFSYESSSQLTRRVWVSLTEKEARTEFAALAEQGYEAVDEDAIPF
jgi:transcriptional regulator with XRE-family HTH domain